MEGNHAKNRHREDSGNSWDRHGWNLGPKSQAALNKEIGRTADTANPTLQRIQRILEVNPDGFWRPISQAALNDEIGNQEGFSVTASSFADPADVVAFKKCKAQGKTDQQCFKVGDNGTGQFRKITAQDQAAMVAVHADDMIARWAASLARRILRAP